MNNSRHRSLINFYISFAASAKFTLISILLPLPMDTHLERAVSATQKTPTPGAYYSSAVPHVVRDPDHVLGMRMTDEPAHFFPPSSKARGWEWEVDTNGLGPESSAFRVAEYVMEGLRADGCFVAMRRAKRA